MQRVTINLNKFSYSPLLLPLFLLIGVMNIIVYLQLLIFLSYFIVYSCSKSNFRNYEGKSEILQLNASPKEWCQYLGRLGLVVCLCLCLCQTSQFPLVSRQPDARDGTLLTRQRAVCSMYESDHLCRAGVLWVEDDPAACAAD